MTLGRRPLPADGDGSRSALQLLRACSGAADADGYVALQTTPYRGHHLLAEAVLGATEPGDRVLEGGVSSGYFAELLVRAGRRVDGIELDPLAAERARRVCDRVWVGDLQQIDVDELDGPYDLLLFGDTLEHVPDPVAVLRALATTLRPGGTLVVSIPNVANWAVRLGLLAGRFRYTDRGILDRTHLRFYTRRTVVEMIEESGFAVDDVVGTIPVPLLHAERLCRVAHRLGNLRPSLFAYTFVVTARLT